MRGSVASTSSVILVCEDRLSGLFTSNTFPPIFNITDAPGAIGSSDPPLLDRFPGLVLCALKSIGGTDIAIPVGADFEFFIGDCTGVDFVGDPCFGDFPPKLQNDDFFVGELAGDAVVFPPFINFAVAGGTTLLTGVLS